MVAEAEDKKEEAGEEEGSRPDEKSTSLLEKIKKAPPWVWVGLAIALGTLIVGYLAYQHSVSTNQGLTPSNAPGSSLPAGSTQAGSYATQGEINNLEQQIQSLQSSWYGGGGGGGGGHHHKKKQ